MKYIVLLFLLLPATLQAAEVYRSVGPDGTVIFSDQPQAGAEKVEIDVIPGYQPVPVPQAQISSDAQPAVSDDELLGLVPDYQLTIINPVDDESVWINDGNVPVDLLIDPELNIELGHRIQILLDGQPSSEPMAQTRFILPYVDRGTHQLSARVLDETGAVIASSGSIVFHLHRATAQQFRDRQQNPLPGTPALPAFPGAPTIPGIPTNPDAPVQQSGSSINLR